MIFSVILISRVASLLAQDSEIPKEYKQSYTKYELDFFTKINECQPGSTVISSLSAHTILGFLASGGDETTARKVFLDVPNSDKKIYEIFKKLTAIFQDERYNLSIFNKVYLQTSYTLQDEFKTKAVNAFNAEIESIDFRGKKSDAALRTINKWVKAKLNNERFEFYLPKSRYDYSNVLVNALYFRREWKTEPKIHFVIVNHNNTYLEDLIISGTYNFYACSNVEYLELPLKGDEISLFLVLPSNETREKCDEFDVFTPPSYLKPTKIHMTIPSFEIKGSIVRRKPTKASFTQVFNDNESLNIDDVLYTASIKISGFGVTATAASGGFQISLKDMKSYFYLHDPCSGKSSDTKPISFYLRSKKLNMNLFAGKYFGRTFLLSTMDFMCLSINCKN